MEDLSLNLASRKAEEAAARRFEAAAWLRTILGGPVKLSLKPSEEEFLSCLRNGLVLCNAINKIKPGAVPKVVEGYSTVITSEFEKTPLPAYQFFENLRNFIKAIEEMKLPAFDASVLERGTLEAMGSTGKIVDCILALKSYHEWVKCGGIGTWKYASTGRSPMVPHCGRAHTDANGPESTLPCRRLDLSYPSDKHRIQEKKGLIDDEGDDLDSINSIIKQISELLFNGKENIDQRIFPSMLLENGEISRLITQLVFDRLIKKSPDSFPHLVALLKAQGETQDYESPNSTCTSRDVLGGESYKGCRSCQDKGSCAHVSLLEAQEKEIKELRNLLLKTRNEFDVLNSEIQGDLLRLGCEVQELSTAALGYHRVVRENRSLYNTLQDLKGNIRVYCRIRPLFGDTCSTVDFIGENGSLTITNPLKQQKEPPKTFQFNKVFGPTSTQDEVYIDTQPLIRSVMDGYNVCIFSYGQTGSGKTYTMCGDSNGLKNNLGINYKALDDLFKISQDRIDYMSYEVQVQMVEIYNEQIRDLLTLEPSNAKLDVRSSTHNGFSVPDASLHLVQSSSDIRNLMNLGQKNRAVSSTAMNTHSSRSHSVLTVHVQGIDTSGSIIRSCLHLVDLAGSERVDKSEATGERLKEALHINKSLSCLGDVIAALAQKSSYIPYRNSKLTQLLQDSLGGQAKTLMFAHVSPEADSYSETISTLKFAERVSAVELGAARVNKENCDIRELREQVECLKKALAKKDGETMILEQKVKEVKSPFEKARAKLENIPPLYRRGSIEGPGFRKPHQSNDLNAIQPPRSPLAAAKSVAEHTPPRYRSSSIEKPTYGKIEIQQQGIKTRKVQTYLSNSISNMPDRSPRTSQVIFSGGKYNQISDSQQTLVSESAESKIRRVMEPDASYTNSSSVDSNSQIFDGIDFPLPLLKTPDFTIFMRNQESETEKQGEPSLLTSKLQLLNSSYSSKKGSHILKSLKHSIRKHNDGSEKRNLLSHLETVSPVYGSRQRDPSVPQSPVVSSTKSTARRQSFTGNLLGGPKSSRRASLGGTRETQPSITPTKVLPRSVKATKRWFNGI